MKHQTKKQRQTANQITIQLEQNIQFRIKTTKISSADYQLAMSWRIRKNREESGSSWTEKAHQILILNFNSTERGLNYLANVRTDLQQVRLNECGRVRKHPVSEHPEELDEAVESKRGEEHRFNPERFSRSWTTSTTTRRGQRRRWKWPKGRPKPKSFWTNIPAPAEERQRLRRRPAPHLWRRWRQYVKDPSLP